MDLKSAFKNPPIRHRMLQIMHNYASEAPEPHRAELESYMGTDDSPGRLAESLERFGYGGIVTNVPFTDYLESDAPWEAFDARMRAIRERGLEFWLYDEKGYPSGKAGGLTLRDHPEFETLGVWCARTEGAGTLRHAMPTGERIVGPPLRIIAAPARDGRIDLPRAVELADTNGDASTIMWDAPDDGAWAVLSFHVNRMYDGTHCVCNVSDTLPYINIIDREAVQRFVDLTHEAYRAHCGDGLARDVAAVFTDEPSLMTPYLKEDDSVLPAAPWSRTFRQDFQKRTGYDVLDALPHLFADCGPESVYKRLDYWGVVAALVEENYYGLIQDWCREAGVAASGHALIEESLYHHVVFQADMYRALRRMDIPGIDLLSSNPTEQARSMHIHAPKLISSVTHMIGARECMSETSSHVQRTGNLPCSFEQRLGTVNYQYALGLTRITSYYGFDEFSDSERRTFNDHIGRLGAVLTQGRHVADVAVYYPVRSFWAAFTPTSNSAYAPLEDERPRRITDAFAAVSLELLANQRDYDYLDDQAVQEAEAKDGTLSVRGEAFRCVVFPETWAIPAATYRRVEEFVDAGGCVATVGALPLLGMTLEETREVAEISARLAASDRVAVCASATEVAGAMGRFIEPDLRIEPACREVFYAHRRLDDGRDVYFLANSLDTAVDLKATFRATGPAEIWHPTTGETRSAECRAGDGVSVLDLHLDAFEGVFFLFG